MSNTNLTREAAEQTIRVFWEQNPCGDHQLGGLEKRFHGDWALFFDEYDRFRYSRERHILRCLQTVDWRDKRVLEVGLGEGADSEQIIRRGALWSGLDLTDEAVKRTRMRLDLKGLRYEEILRGPMSEMPFPEGRFDIIFCHGALPCVPDIASAQREFSRVLKKRGKLIVMLYAKGSLNYLLAISVLRRLGLIFLYYSGLRLGGKYDAHVDQAHTMGLWRYLRMENFIHRNTDGPDNPYIRLHWKSDVARDFPLFEIDLMHKEFMHAPPLPVSRLPGARLLGWHLWVHMTRR
jgi:SAM-dependent methyltransferase